MTAELAGPFFRPASFFSIMKLLIGVFALAQIVSAQTVAVTADRYSFGEVSLEAPVEHEFRFTNTGMTALRVRNVELTPPLIVSRMKSIIAPQGEGRIVIRLDGPRTIGKFSGRIQVNFDSPETPPALFHVSGAVVEPIEFRPAKAIFAATTRGTTREVFLEIINHEKEPLELSVDNPSGAHYQATLFPVTEGREFRLAVRLTGEGPAGRSSETLRLWTSNPKQRIIEIAVNSLLNERVYTFPPEVDLGRISTAKIKARPALAKAIQANVMVYQKGGSDFQIEADTQVPFLHVEAEKSTRFPDRWQLRVTLLPEKLKDGSIQGDITVKTNDREFPVLRIPVLGSVDGSW